MLANLSFVGQKNTILDNNLSNFTSVEISKLDLDAISNCSFVTEQENVCRRPSKVLFIPTTVALLFDNVHNTLEVPISPALHLPATL